MEDNAAKEFISVVQNFVPCWKRAQGWKFPGTFCYFPTGAFSSGFNPLSNSTAVLGGGSSTLRCPGQR